MTPAENVAFAWKHRDLFAEVQAHNGEVIRHRLRGGDWDDPNFQYRNTWAEAERVEARARREAQK